MIEGAEGDKSIYNTELKKKIHNCRTRKDSKILLVQFYCLSFSAKLSVQRLRYMKPHSSYTTVRA